MNSVLEAPTNLPRNQARVLAGIRKLSGNYLLRMTRLSSAVAHVVAGPPMSDRARYNQSLVEARTKNLDVFTDAWCWPR